MRIYPNLCILVIFYALLFVPAPHAVGGELIQPTRTLKSAEKLPGRLSVFSEPSGLDVFLNHSKIGKTPISFMEVAPGRHSLKVNDTETQIYVTPGKSLRLSLFKGTFIKVEEPERETIQNPDKKISGTIPAQASQEKRGYQPEYDPAYWPLKPNGPIK
jgi:hypothetical protein